MKRGTFHNLERGTTDRMLARLAWRANGDTIMGGASALVLAKRAKSLGLPSAGEMRDAVDSTYRASLGRVPAAWAVVECPECGQWYLGEDKAAACCADNGEDIDDGDDETSVDYRPSRETLALAKSVGVRI